MFLCVTISEHNTKVAINRWARVRTKERRAFATDSEAAVMRAALCGFLAGDGSVKKRVTSRHVRYDIRFFPDDQLMLETYLHFFERVYRKKPAVTPMKGYYNVQLSSRTIGEDFFAMATFGLYTWRPPLLENNEQKIAWLRAFFSAEGYVGIKAVRVQTVNANGMEFVSELLAGFNIHHRCYVYVPKNNNHSSVHIVTILRKNDRLLFADLIGFWHARKTNVLEKTLHLKPVSESVDVPAAVA